MILPSIEPLDAAAIEVAQMRWNAVAKPLHSMGRFEDLIIQIAGIQKTPNIRLLPRCIWVFCADHGIVAQGVTQSQSDVTEKVARSMAMGTSNVHLLAGSICDVVPVDMGMIHPLEDAHIRDCRIGSGTADFSLGPAMSRDQAEAALMAGISFASESAQKGYALLAVGEMGIGNTSAATAITCVLLRQDPLLLTGRGAGLSDEGLRRKQTAISRGIAVNLPNPDDPIDVLSKVGGFEIGAMTGLMLGAAQHRIPVVLDGAIAAAAALLAVSLCPGVKDFLLPSHLSRSPVAAAALDALNLKPVLHADMGLGEGTGAVMLFPLLDMAAALYNGTHTFDDLNMAPYQEGGQI